MIKIENELDIYWNDVVFDVALETLNPNTSNLPPTIIKEVWKELSKKIENELNTRYKSNPSFLYALASFTINNAEYILEVGVKNVFEKIKKALIKSNSSSYNFDDLITAIRSFKYY